MPFTFLAHQVPVLPLARRWPGRIDGVALVIGSMAPDLAFVLDGTRLGLDAHPFPAWLLFGVPVTLVVSWLVARVLAPVVPDHLPDLAPFHLHDFRGLAASRARPLAAVVGAVVGVLSHVLLDQFTHSWGWFARHLDWWSTPLVDRSVLGREWPLYRVLQHVGHVVGSAVGVWLLARWGRSGWMAGRAAVVPRATVSRRSAVVLWGLTAAGLVGGAVWAGLASAGIGPLVMRTAAGAFAGLTVGSLAVRSTVLRRPSALSPV